MIAVGTDILKFERINDVLERLGDRFVERILTPAEREEYAASVFTHLGANREEVWHRESDVRDLINHRA